MLRIHLCKHAAAFLTLQTIQNKALLLAHVNRKFQMLQLPVAQKRYTPIDVYDARELLPWLRSFITRITSLECSNAAVRRTFMQDLQELTAYYSEV